MKLVTFETVLDDWQVKFLEDYAAKLSKQPGELSWKNMAMAILKNAIAERSGDAMAEQT